MGGRTQVCLKTLILFFMSKPIKTILDANVWIAFFYTNDSTHKKAVKIFQELREQELVITEYIILEVATILKKVAGIRIAEQFLETLAKSSVSVIQDSDLLQQTIPIFLKSGRNNLSFVDCSLVYLSNRYNVKTFDKKLKAKLENAMF